MRETSKSYLRRKTDPFWGKIFKGVGIDIGSGEDAFKSTWFPGVDSVRPFDTEDGDAQFITRFVKGSFDFVHSSNCLEHMVSPEEALLDWWKLVKPGGYLVFTVPDEDLYEQGVFPSRWNGDHKWTFTIFKGGSSWSPKSVNALEIVSKLPECQIIRSGVIDTNYDYSLTGVDQTRLNAEAFIEIVLKKKSVIEFEPMTFKHSGARGDIIYSLPTIKALGGGKLYLTRESGAYVGRPMSIAELEWFRSILVGNCGITEVQEWTGQQVQYNLDKFRSSGNLIEKNLCDAHLDVFGVSANISAPWLDSGQFTPNPIAQIIINRSGRYPGPIRWQELKNWVRCSVFVGFEEEWKNFKELTGFSDLPLYCPSNYADLCEVLLGCKLFVGNQSFVYSLAEAFKVNRVQEACPLCPNCTPQSDNGHLLLNQEIIRHYVEGDGTPLGKYNKVRSLLKVRNRFSGSALPRQPKVSSLIPGRPLISFVILGEDDALVKSLNTLSSKEVFNANWGTLNEVVKRTSGSLICVVEPGTRLIGTWFQEMMGLMGNPTVGAVGQSFVLGSEISISGGVVLLQRAACQECGLPSGEVEDKWLDLSRRLRRFGYTIRQVRSRNISTVGVK